MRRLPHHEEADEFDEETEKYRKEPSMEGGGGCHAKYSPWLVSRRYRLYQCLPIAVRSEMRALVEVVHQHVKMRIS